MIIDKTNEDLDIKIRSSISAMNDKASKGLKKNAEQMMKTPEGIKKLQDWMNSGQMQNPYSDDYGVDRRNQYEAFTKDLPQGDTMGTGDFR